MYPFQQCTIQIDLMIRVLKVFQSSALMQVPQETLPGLLITVVNLISLSSVFCTHIRTLNWHG